MLGIVVGLAAEARLARGLGGQTAIGGGGPDGAIRAAMHLVAAGARGLVSFGLAGGLSPAMKAGDIIVPEAVMSQAGDHWAADDAMSVRLGRPAGLILAATAIIGSRAAKEQAWERTGALAVDLESAAVAQVATRHGLPFSVLRAVCDPADRDLPEAAMTALDSAGRIRPMAMMRSLARHPGQIPALIALGREAARARQALLVQVAAIGRLD